MAWITPIYDRTNADVLEVATTKSAWLADPSSAVVTDLKGCLNYADLNRIEGNMSWLRDELIALGYIISEMDFRLDWSLVDYSDLTTNWQNTQFIRLLNNLTNLISHMPVGYITRSVPYSMIHYNQINDIEYIELQVWNFIYGTINSFRYSGTVVSGDRS
jgi:hypothetical protein